MQKGILADRSARERSEPQEQWERLLPLAKHLKASSDENLVLNKLIEITAPGH